MSPVLRDVCYLQKLSEKGWECAEIGPGPREREWPSPILLLCPHQAVLCTSWQVSSPKGSHSFFQILTDQREVGWLEVIFCSSLQYSVSFLQSTASSFIWYQVSSLSWLLEALQASCINFRHLPTLVMCYVSISDTTLLVHILGSLKILDSPYKICGLEWALEFRCCKKTNKWKWTSKSQTFGIGNQSQTRNARPVKLKNLHTKWDVRRLARA